MPCTGCKPATAPIAGLAPPVPAMSTTYPKIPVPVGVPPAWAQVWLAVVMFTEHSPKAEPTAFCTPGAILAPIWKLSTAKLSAVIVATWVAGKLPHGTGGTPPATSGIEAAGQPNSPPLASRLSMMVTVYSPGVKPVKAYCPLAPTSCGFGLAVVPQKLPPQPTMFKPGAARMKGLSGLGTIWRVWTLQSTAVMFAPGRPCESITCPVIVPVPANGWIVVPGLAIATTNTGSAHRPPAGMVITSVHVVVPPALAGTGARHDTVAAAPPGGDTPGPLSTKV